MAPTICGLDFSEIKRSKLSYGNTLGTRGSPLRRSKLVFYSLLQLLYFISQVLCAVVVMDSMKMERAVHNNMYPGVDLYDHGYMTAAIVYLLASSFVSAVFGMALFLELFWPVRDESRLARTIGRVLAALALGFRLLAATLLTTVTAGGGLSCSGVDAQQVCRTVISHSRGHGELPLEYRHDGRAVAAMVFAWLAWQCAIASTILLFAGMEYTKQSVSEKAVASQEADPETVSTPEPLTHLDPTPIYDGTQLDGQSDMRLHTVPATREQLPRIHRASRFLEQPSQGEEDTSMVSENTADTTFSALAIGKGKSDKGRESTLQARLGDKSLAALTSGMAGGDWRVR
ncbi:hypothetical protein LTR62_000676 [Meristemomyces frigidus]|uniref:Transmembrane protein n=1 Tax=Meristemomyces frigidus TaxID=1508187 RepID=A0AAN7TCV0_9PEZI|nr:hypothetical protein LTR62_000676 [Meristemomyces frigidus]